MTTQKKQSQRVGGVDGLRAVAALLVVAYHLFPRSVSAGFIGVDVFFVISGFLITSLLLGSMRRTGTLELGHFWMKRIRRLVPAVVVTTLVSLALARIVGGDALVGASWQAFGSLTGTYNWFQIAHSASYFDQQSPLLLTNMWTLAVEQQFYLVWPIILILILQMPRRWRPWGALAVGALSVVFAAFSVAGADDVTATYVGTHTHAYGLMIGAAIALTFPRALEGHGGPATPEARRAVGVGSWVAFAGLIAFAVLVPDGRWMYPWGTVIASLLAGAVIVGFVGGEAAPARSLMSVLNARPFVWLGERSYGIYLWHWPLYVLGFYAFHPNPTVMFAVVLVLSILLAHISYTFVETPIRRMGFTGAWRAIVSRNRGRAWIAAVEGVVAALVFGLAVAGVATSRSASSAEDYIKQGESALGAPSAKPLPTPKATTSAAPAPATSAPAPTTPAPTKAAPTKSAPAPTKPAPAPSAKAPAKPAAPIDSSQVTIIGDSVTVAAAPALRETFPNAIIDGKVSRSIRTAPDIINDYKAQGKLGKFVVISLATNGTIRPVDWETVDQAVGPDRKVVLVTGYGPADKTWIGEANGRIHEIASTHPDRVRVADWAAIAAGHLDDLAGDHVHPDQRIAPLYAQAIADAIRSF